ncbi:MAG: enoyl-CoA hydratase [Planctomycetaceae bacterium]|nr:enoyl-CoA hydratase [Planctomycetaceae bacterium]
MSTPSEPQILRHQENGVVTLRLNRPERRHALSRSLLEELEQALSEIRNDRSVRVVVFASSGPVFSSGHDLGEMRGRDADDYQRLFATCSRVMLSIRELPQPVIARVQGFATAAGCQLVAACDLAVAADTARFATPGVKIGLFCTTPMVPLVRNVAPKVAMEMLLTGQPISAERALSAGLVNRVVPENQLDEAIRELTDAILSSSPAVVAMGKREFYAQLPLDEPSAYARATEAMTSSAQAYEAQEGISAFLEKREPKWGAE